MAVCKFVIFSPIGNIRDSSSVLLTLFVVVKVYGNKRHFQQYFIYIMAVSFIGGGNRSTRRKLPTCRKCKEHTIRFLQPHTRTITMQCSFFPSALRTWNTLPQQLASMTFLEGFRQALTNTTIVP